MSPPLTYHLYLENINDVIQLQETVVVKQSEDGWIPTDPSNASLNLAFEQFKKDIKTIAITRLVSYGTSSGRIVRCALSLVRMRRRIRLAYLRIKICAYEYHAKLMKNRDLKEQRMKPKKKANADEPICYYLIRFTMYLI